MKTTHIEHSNPLSRRPVAACLMLALAASSCAAATAAAGNTPTPLTARARLSVGAASRQHAPTATVTNCDDDGDGSLRATIAAASTGDTIDLTALACSTISLSTGFIDIPQGDLSLIGPGPDALTIDAGSNSGVLRHTGAGTLSISGLRIANGYYESVDTPRGGCVSSMANISIAGSTLENCAAIGQSDALARGGAIYAYGNLSLTSSLVTSSQARGTTSGGEGGGLYVRGNFTANFSRISYNMAIGAPINASRAGGAMIVGTTLIKASTISYNSAYAVGGLYTEDAVTVDSSTIYGNGASHTAGMRAIYNQGSPTATIVNSTIAGNVSHATSGGLNLIIPAKISNSTIAFNTALNGLAGVLMSGPTLDLESTIIAGNTGFGVPDDFAVYGSVAVNGAGNLVVASSAPLPPDTITDDPLLGVPGDNGGPTWTIPLLDGSPAIDAGNNDAHLPDDQRGLGFARSVGPGTDIGAFEVQGNEVIFADGFDKIP